MLIQIVEDDFALSNGIRLALSQPEIDFFRTGKYRKHRAAFRNKSPI